MQRGKIRSSEGKNGEERRKRMKMEEKNGKCIV